MTDRIFTEALRASALKAGLIGLSTLGLAACQTAYSGDGEPSLAAPRPAFPVRAERNPSAPPAEQAYNPPAPLPSQSPAQGVTSSESIETTALPPPSQSQTQAPYNPPAYNPPAPSVSAPPQMRTVAAGRVVEADGPSENVTVKAGDTLYSISKRMDMTVKQVADLNGLKEPYTVRPGQTIKGKPSRGKAYVVESGDTLSAIGRRFSVSPAQIATANETDVATPIRPGQRLILPQGYRDQGAQQVAVAAPRAASPVIPAPAPTPVAPAPVAAAPRPAPAATASAPTTPPPAARPQTPPAAATANARANAPVIIPTAPPASAGDIQTIGRGKFVWPVSGRQLSGFGSRGASQQSNGVNIAARMGAPVKAAAAGEVIYAGSELQGYGNLVLVRHDNGFVTVYAHLDRIEVKMEDRVTQGQELGSVGQSGGVAEPQLYFEIRHQQSQRDAARPFDPMLVLPPIGDSRRS